jgi:hypothetical protein
MEQYENERNESRKDIRVELCKVIATAVLTYGRGNWALKRSEGWKIEGAETPFLRHLSLKPGSSHMGFVVDEVALGQVFSEYFSFLC